MTDWRVPLCIDGAEIQELRDIAKRATDELLLAREVVKAAREIGCESADCMGYGFCKLEVALQAYDEGEK